MGKYVGIDLGTTFSVVAYIDSNGNPQVIESEDGRQRVVSSTVYYGDKKIVVGDAAKKNGSKDPGNYVELVKRHMGDSGYVVRLKNGQVLRPEEVSAQILKYLKERAEERLGDRIEGAVITVPAYFGDSKRKATKDAAEIAGIKVLDIINEPTAAAIAFGIEKNVKERQNIMIYDLGGGTFDVSILEIGDNEIRVIATGGNSTLGGCDIDETVITYIKEKAAKQGIDIDSDAKTVQKIKFVAENVKKDLSTLLTATTEDLYVKGEELEVELDRKTFNNLIENIVNHTISTVQEVVYDAGLDYNELDKILLVGGSTRIPRIRESIEEVTDIKPSSEVNPDEAVAIGAAYHAIDMANKLVSGEIVCNHQNKDEEIKVSILDVPKLDNNYKFTDVTSHSIGMVALDSEKNNIEINTIILERNSPIPAQSSRTYYTVEPFQNLLTVEVTQGEDEDLDFVNIIGEADLKLEPRDHIFPIKVSVGCDAQGIIHVYAYDIEKNINLGEFSISRSEFNMSTEEVKAAKHRMIAQ